MVSSPWRLSLFGTVGLHSDSCSLTDFETKRAAKILVLLSFSRNGKLRREDLADLLWPEDFIDSTRLRLRQELSRLRRGIGDAADIIHASTDDVSIDKSQIMDDLDRLSQPDSIGPDELVTLLSESFLAGWDDPWVIPKRQEADQVRVRAAIACATKLLEEKHPALALQVSRAALRLASQNEDIVKLAIQAHTDLGSLSEAVIEFRKFQRSPNETREATEKPTDEVSEVKLPALPNPIDKFYGREQLVAIIREKVHQPYNSRLITLVGPGGIGKTRLSIEALKGIDASIGFIPFVECLPDQSPESFLVSKMLDGVVVPDPLDALSRILTGKNSWLVLDNLEHLNDPGGFVARLLAAIPDLKLLVTARKSMKVSGEDVIAVGPLSSEDEALPMLNELVDNRRLASAQVDEYREIIELCGGFPLTLRLAAARLRMLEPAELIHDIKESTATLQANLADLPDRHRSFNEMLKVSFDSLSDEDTTALLQIGCFPGGVTRAITRTLVGSTVDAVLDRLLDSSLIWLDDEKSPMRFRLFGPVRQFIRGEDTEENRQTMNQSFIKCMTDIALTLTPGWKLPPESDTTLFRREATNLQAALNLALEVDHASAHIIFERIWDAELSAGGRENLLDWAEKLEKLANVNDFQLGQIELVRAWCFSAEGQLEKVSDSAQRAKGQFEKAGALPEACYAISCNFEATRHKLDWSDAERGYEELLTMATKVAPDYAASVRVSRGMVLTYRDEWDRAKADLEFGFEQAKKAGNLGLQIMAGTALLIVQYAKGQTKDLPNRLNELTGLLRELDDSHYWAIFLRNEAHLALAQGNFAEAEHVAGQGRSVFSLARHPMHEVEIRLILCRALIHQGKKGAAEEIFQEIFPDIDQCLKRVKVVALVCLAELKLANNEPEPAKNLMGLANAYRDQNNLRLVIFESEYLVARTNEIGQTMPEDDVPDQTVMASLSN